MAWRDILKSSRGSAVDVLDRKPGKLLSAIDTDFAGKDDIVAYRKACEEVGVDSRDIAVEEFKAFLARHDMPTFNLREVVKYMDELAYRDNPTGLGWHWCPVRLKDADVPMRFGTMPVDQRFVGEKKAGSDYYSSHDMDGLRRAGRYQPSGMGNVAGTSGVAGEYEIVWQPRDMRTHRSAAYTHTLPIHALKKIAFIEKQWQGPQVVFLVSDYTTEAHLPDPFLMACIDNSAVAFGKGRFVIDVWDEPGFGISQMLK